MELEAKKKLRQHARADRELQRNSERKLFQWLHLLTAQEMLNAVTIATYISYGDEPNTSALNSQLLAQQKKLILPRMRQDKSLEWVPWNGTAENLKSQGNIKEPIGNSLAENQLATIDAVIVPALLVDRRGFRLGQGGGSYDRALKELSIFSPHVWSVALVYDGEVTSSNLPNEAHDVPLNAVATPELVIRFSKNS
mgnify:FL=1